MSSSSLQKIRQRQDLNVAGGMFLELRSMRLHSVEMKELGYAISLQREMDDGRKKRA